MPQIKKDQSITLKDCTLASALKVVGERWTLLLLRELFYGTTRFDDMQRHLSVSRRVLSERLSKMVKVGLLQRSPYRDAKQRTRYEYRPTQMAKDLRTTLIALLQWGDRYFPNPSGRPLALVHAASGAEVMAGIIITGQGEPLAEADELQPIYWPDRKAKPQVRKRP